MGMSHAMSCEDATLSDVVGWVVSASEKDEEKEESVKSPFDMRPSKVVVSIIMAPHQAQDENYDSDHHAIVIYWASNIFYCFQFSSVSLSTWYHVELLADSQTHNLVQWRPRKLIAQCAEEEGETRTVETIWNISNWPFTEWRCEIQSKVKWVLTSQIRMK